MRCFVAIMLPEDVKSKIFHLSENIQGKGLVKGRFVKKEDLHLTLKFLGFLTQEKIEEIRNNLGKIKYKSFKCSLGKAGVFDEKHIKVIWVELVSDALEDLHNEINESTNEIRLDYKKFEPHITLARVDSVSDKEKLLTEIRKINLKKLEFDVDCFYLVKSEFNTKKSKYKIIEKFQF